MTDAAPTSDAAATGKDASATLAAQLEERLIHQEYKIWKKNTPFLYDFVMTHGLEWPSLTCQWLPTKKELNDGNKVGAVGGVSKNVAEQHELLLGTHTTGEQNYLMVASVNLPREDAVIDNRTEGDDDNNNDDNKDASAGNDEKKTTSNIDEDAVQASKKVKTIDAPNPATNYNEEKDELGGHNNNNTSSTNNNTSNNDNSVIGKIDIKMKIPHAGEVNRARYMPQNHFVVATRGPSSDVYIWDLSKHSSFPPEGENEVIAPNPQAICRGHAGEGYGVAWCGIEGDDHKGRLATCAEDRTVKLWNVSQALKDGKNGTVISAEATLEYHTEVVEDVDWHNRDPNMIGSCGDDRMVCLWDVREGKRNKPVHVVRDAHEGDVNSLEFHPVNEFLLASGGSDKVVKLWDMRNLKSPLQTFEGHTDQVYSIHWSPFNESILASCSADRRIALWDLSRIGMEQTPEDAEDGPPELLFLHGGHTSKVNDFSWNPNYDWCLGGVSEDNVLQVWSPAEDVYAEEEEDDEEEEDLAMKQRTEILGDDELE